MSKNIGRRTRTAISVNVIAPGNVVAKLKRARYAKDKQKQRELAKHHEKLQVIVIHYPW